MMGTIVGIVLAILVSALARWTRFDRDRAFYPMVLVAVASYYVLFAVMGGSGRAILVETVVMTVFLVMVLFGFKRSLWIVVVGLAAHGVLDHFHGRLVDNPGVPVWWPEFCMAYDVVAAVILAWILRRARVD